MVSLGVLLSHALLCPQETEPSGEEVPACRIKASLDLPPLLASFIQQTQPRQSEELRPDFGTHSLRSLYRFFQNREISVRFGLMWSYLMRRDISLLCGDLTGKAS